MPKARTALASLIAGAALLSTAPSAGATFDYVTVTDENGVITVSTQLPGQPLLGASYYRNTGKVCVGFSYQIPFCRVLPVDAIAFDDPFDGQPPVVVDADPSDGTVGVYTGVPGQPLLGVRVDLRTGEVCAGFSYQVPFCVQLGPFD